MSSSRGPSPIVPLLVVGALGMAILGPGAMTAFGVLLSWCLPIYGVYHDRSWQRPGSSMAYDSEGYILGALILILFFFVLYALLSCW
ncbi:unnamed protein product [Linum trigynum]|uniref:Uncharacterized protein n=1 Tax=Linum trigynum TaxID=586398 RepID=A0AAV2EA30_9ROSI